MKNIFWTIWLLIFATAIVSACEGGAEDPNSPVTSLDFDRVCKGEALAKAPAFDPEAAGIHRVIVMSDSTIGDQYEEYFTQFVSDMPEEWAAPLVEGTFDYGQVELVACIHRTAAEAAESCEFEDGYFLNVHNTSYEMVLIAAQSGVEVDRTTFDIAGECPMLHMFDEGETQEPYYPVVDGEEILAFIEPHVDK